MSKSPFTIYPRKTKKGVLYYAQFRRSDGTRTPGRPTGCKSKAAAKEWCVNELRREGNLTLMPANSVTLADFAGTDFFGWGSPWALDKRAAGKRLSPRHCLECNELFARHVVPALGDMKLAEITEDTIREYRNTINASNVVGIIEGTDKKDEYIFLTGHYDHLGMRNGKIYYGADDDGSGTVAVINMAEAFMKAAKEGYRPRRTIVFMTVSGEEKGLWGSEYYSDHPFYPLDKTSVNLNTDMVGRIDTERKTADSLNYVYVIGHDKLSSELPIINEGVNNKYTQLVLDYKFDDPADPNRIYFRSDHYNFARKGVPILFFYDGMLKSDYHQPGDTVDKIYWDLYEKRVRMIFHTAWEMANRDSMLKRDTPLNMGSR